MTILGLKEAEVAQLVRAVTPDQPGIDLQEIEIRFARAAWGGIVEPGDSAAGRVIEAIGPVRALVALHEKWPVDRLVEECAGGVAPGEASSGIERWQPRLHLDASVLALRQATRYGVRFLVPGDPLWPEGVDDLQDHKPIGLWVRGTDDACLSLSRSIALVGARAATGYGEHITMEASAGLVDRGYAIVSGAAYGIDGMAHRAALASHGQTIAFLAGGVDRFYPSGHDALLNRIVERGAVISELPCGASPTRWRFLQRNRLIAASSLATIVLEAGWRSGSLNTAGHAGDLGRPLGAVPGPVTSAASAGCHKLIREFNAICVTNADEMAELAPLPAAPASGAPEGDSGGLDHTAEARVREALSTHAPRSAAELAARAGLSVADVTAQLGGMELEGTVRERNRGWLAVAPEKSASSGEPEEEI